MKKITSILLVVLSLVLLGSALTVGVSASSAYQTYTYSINGTPLYSPDAYAAVKTVDYIAMGLTKDFKNPQDLITDSAGNVYIADTDNSRVVCLDRYYNATMEISEFINDQGNTDALLKPQGVFVTETDIWVCDTDNSRLVRFEKATGNFLQIVGAPESQLFGDSSVYKPVAMAIDQYGRIYVVSSTTYQGIIVLDPSGEFVGFIGAQAVSISAWDILWRRFQTEEQKRQTAAFLPTEFNNICLSTDGFVYVTISSIEAEDVEAAINKKDKEGKNMPVKLLNPAGDEIMRRNGFWPPAGEVDYNNLDNEKKSGASTVTDVAQGPEKTWTIIDSKRNKLYTYDFNGSLLFAFGDEGDMLGSIRNIEAVTYQGDTMLVLDRGAGNNGVCVVVYERTEYGNLLLQAIAAENSLDYSYAIECWEAVLQRNSNFDAAYVGIGNALSRSGRYEESMEYYETAYDTENWSESYKQVRKEWMADWFILILAIIIIVIVAVLKFLGWAARVNKRVSTDGKARKKFWQELIYAFYVMFHPFDGFYDLKHERRGSVRAALVILGGTIVAFFYQSIGQGYVLNPTGAISTIWAQAISVLIPLFLFVLGNWCLTTLFEGEGSFKDIFVACSYALTPMPLLIIPATLCSNWVTTTEASLITMVTTIGMIWMLLLLFCATMVTHDYSLGKNFVTVIGTVVAMAFIVFIVLLFSMLLSKLISLVTNIVIEIQFRIA